MRDDGGKAEGAEPSARPTFERTAFAKELRNSYLIGVACSFQKVKSATYHLLRQFQLCSLNSSSQLDSG